MLYAVSGTPSSWGASLAIVMDDVGYSVERAERILALPRKITLGMLPFAPHTAEILELAAANGQEIILHQPMEPISASHVRDETGTLTLAMAPDRFGALFDQALAAVPLLVGVNNHTGSLLTQHRQPMDLLMRHIGARGLFFLDSRTTPMTVAMSSAQALQVPAVQRDVFLDHFPTPAAMRMAYDQALAIARRKGHAVVIAHPYLASIEFLEDVLGRLPKDVEVTSLAALVAQQRVLQKRGDARQNAPRKAPKNPSPVRPDPAVLALSENPAYPRR